MYEELLKEFKTFREQVYAKFVEYDEILRTLISSNSEKIVSTFTDENAVKVIDLCPVWTVGISVAKGGTIVLQFLPSQLVGQYFEVVEV